MSQLDEARKTINEIDDEMARLFVRRMEAVGLVAAYKQANGLPILDDAREAQVIQRGFARVENDDLRRYYLDFIRSNMEISRAYQRNLLESGRSAALNGVANVQRIDLPQNGYEIVLERGGLEKARQWLDLGRRVLVVTDDGVPAVYAKTVAAQCKSATIVTLPMGEGSKSFSALEHLLRTMLQAGFTRTDCVVAVGGGVVGDLSGFAAASFMRGIDFYNIPTTILSQIDSSIGGKVAINLDHVKNAVGAFHQPRRVLIDPDVLSTLPARQIANGLAEAVKMALTSDAALFALFESGDAMQKLDEVIARAIAIKKKVVEQDEREAGLRRILNFGHTLGHGIEAFSHLHGLYHGECVALGMIPMCAPDVRKRLLKVLKMLNLPTEMPMETEPMLYAVAHDKKCSGDRLSAVYVPAVGTYEIRQLPLEAWKQEIRSALQG